MSLDTRKQEDILIRGWDLIRFQDIRALSVQGGGGGVIHNGIIKRLMVKC